MDDKVYILKVNEDEFRKYTELMTEIRNSHNIDGNFIVNPDTGDILTARKIEVKTHESAVNNIEEMKKEREEKFKNGRHQYDVAMARGRNIRAEANERADKLRKEHAMPSMMRKEHDGLSELIMDSMRQREAENKGGGYAKDGVNYGGKDRSRYQLEHDIEKMKERLAEKEEKLQEKIDNPDQDGLNFVEDAPGYGADRRNRRKYKRDKDLNKTLEERHPI